MPQQNGRLNTDIDKILTSAYHDGEKWIIYTVERDGDNESIGATTDSQTSSSVIGLLKGLKSLFPATLSNGSIRSQIMGALPAGTNTIGKVEVTNQPSNQTSIEVSNFPATQQVEVINQNTAIDKTVKNGSLFGTKTIAISATKLSVNAIDLIGRHTLRVFNSSETDVYIGYDDTVTVDNGYPLKVGKEHIVDLNPETPLSIYAISTVDSIVRLTEEK
jgi:hypothetical protein